MKKLLLTMVLAVATLVGLTGPASAATDNYTTHAFGCTTAAYDRGRVVNAYPPTMTTTASGTNVYWWATLYRYGSSGWQPYEGSGWNNGVGYQASSGYWVNSGGVGITFYQFSNLPTGSYELRNFMQWQDGATANAYSVYTSTSWYCTFS